MNDHELIVNPDPNGKRIIAVTGHRPNELGGYNYVIRSRLESFATGILAERKPDLVITGMAQGWDQAVALACRTLAIPYWAAIPVRGQEGMWPLQAQDFYRELLRDAVGQTIVSEGGYAAWKMTKRNEFMINRATSVLALWNGDPDGGTAHAVGYAYKSGRDVENVWRQFEKF